jgi:hypothetical protein
VPLLMVSWFIVWFFIAPLVLVYAHGLVQNRWMLQNTSREWRYIAVATVAWFLTIAVPLVLWFKWGEVPWRQLAGLAGWSLVAGWHWGYFALNLMNHSSTAVGQPVEFKSVHLLKGTIEIRAIGDDYDGIIFECSTSLWRKRGAWDTGTAPGFVYRGKLGLYWAELPEK